MKILDLIHLAAKNLKGKWAVLPIIGIAISMFCFSFAGAVLTTVQKEKALPYELIVTSETTSLTNGAIAQIAAVPDVTAVTPVLEVPVNIKTGEYFAQLDLTGIDAAYLNYTFAQGGRFLDDSIMPYIVLNKAACERFSSKENDEDFKSGTETPKIDWLNADVTVQMGEGARLVVSKISGILANNEEGQEPAAYISISSAKELLRQSGQSTDYAEVNVRITNIGHADSVSKVISALGLSVINPSDELQTKWDIEMNEVTYLIVIGLFGLLCSSVLMLAWRKISMLEQKEAFTALRWIGMKDKGIGRLFIIQSAMIILIGIAGGGHFQRIFAIFSVIGDKWYINIYITIVF